MNTFRTFYLGNPHRPRLTRVCHGEGDWLVNGTCLPNKSTEILVGYLSRTKKSVNTLVVGFQMTPLIGDEKHSNVNKNFCTGVHSYILFQQLGLKRISS